MLLLEQLREGSEVSFEVLLKSRIACQCFPLIVSCCCDIQESKDMSFV